jgi:hypothetical protein
MEANKELSKAMFNNSMPCNPIPFLNGIVTGCKNQGSDYIQTDEAKRILYILLCQSYGQVFNINAFEEFNRLKRTI